MSDLNVSNINANSVETDSIQVANTATIGSISSTISLTNFSNSSRPAAPATGTIIWNTDSQEVQVWNGDSWTNISKSAAIRIPITNGLIVELDAGNSASYSGSGNTWTDLSNSSNDGSISNAVWSNFGEGSFEFNNSNALIDLNSSLIGSGSNQIGTGEANSDYTLMAWVYVRSSQGTTTNADSIVGTAGTYGVGMQVGASSSQARVNYGARGTSNYYGNTFAYNTWTHIALSRIAGNSVRSYENGGFVASTTSTNLEVQSGQTYGNMKIGNASPRVSGWFDGYISMVHIFNRGLSESEVNTVYNTFKGRFGL